MAQRYSPPAGRCACAAPSLRGCPRELRLLLEGKPRCRPPGLLPLWCSCSCSVLR